MTDFLPHISQIEARLGLGETESLQTVDRVVVDGAFLRFLLRRIAEGFALDARAYRKEHGLSTGADWDGLASASEHFAATGFLAGLSATPRNFDEDWYLSTYPDVRAAIQEGGYEDGLAHYLAVGRSEWRLPNPAVSEAVHDWRRILRPVREDPVHVAPAKDAPGVDVGAS